MQSTEEPTSSIVSLEIGRYISRYRMQLIEEPTTSTSTVSLEIGRYISNYTIDYFSPDGRFMYQLGYEFLWVFDTFHNREIEFVLPTKFEVFSTLNGISVDEYHQLICYELDSYVVLICVRLDFDKKCIIELDRQQIEAEDLDIGWIEILDDYPEFALFATKLYEKNAYYKTFSLTKDGKILMEEEVSSKTGKKVNKFTKIDCLIRRTISRPHLHQNLISFLDITSGGFIVAADVWTIDIRTQTVTLKKLLFNNNQRNEYLQAGWFDEKLYYFVPTSYRSDSRQGFPTAFYNLNTNKFTQLSEQNPWSLIHNGWKGYLRCTQNGLLINITDDTIYRMQIRKPETLENLTWFKIRSRFLDGEQFYFPRDVVERLPIGPIFKSKNSI